MRFPGVCAIATGACLVSLPSGAQTEKGLSPADVSKINEVSRSQVKAALAKDWPSFAAIYTDDAVLNPPNEPAVKGRAAIQAWAEKFPPMTDFTLSNVQMEGCGDLAYVLGSYTMTITPPGAAGPVKDSGKYVEIRRRQPDGKWLIAVDIFNSDLPAEPPE
jgi:uncharacterized protein (TIGR02246 family)